LALNGSIGRHPMPSRAGAAREVIEESSALPGKWGADGFAG